MLKAMRSNVKSLSWTLWLVIIAFVGFVFIEWGAGELGSKGAGNTIAWVGDAKISAPDFENNLRQTLNNYRTQLKGNLNRQFINQMGIPAQILQRLVYITLIEIEAKKMGLTVSDEEIVDSVKKIPAFQREGKFVGVDEYIRFLQYQHIRVNDFEEGIAQEILSDKMKDLLGAHLVLDPETLEREYRKEKDSAEIEYVSFKPENVSDNQSSIAEEELRKEYEKNPGQYMTDEKRAGSAVVLKYNDFKKEISLKEKEIRDHYNENRENFVVPGRTKISRIFLKYIAEDRDQVLAQLDGIRKDLDKNLFPEKAREFSQDDKAKDGGDWGYWEWQNFSQQERDTIERLNEGDISNSIDTGEGFSLLLVSEKVPEKRETQAEAAPKIKTTLEREKLKELVQGKINKLFSKAKSSGSLSRSAASLKTKVVETALLKKGEIIKDIDPVGYISQQLFTLKKDEISDPFEMADGMAVVQLSAIQPPKEKTFEEATEEIRTKLSIEIELDALETRALRLRETLQGVSDSKPIEEAVKADQKTLETATYKRGGSIGPLNSIPGLEQKIFALEADQISAPIRFDKEILLIRMKNKTVTTKEEFEKDRPEYFKQKMSSLKDQVFSSYIMNKREEFEIRFNQQLYDQVVKNVLSSYR